MSLITIIGACLVWTMPIAHAARPLDLSTWTPATGDRMMVDVANNWGYLFHERGSDYLLFPVATGQRDTIRYIGRVYYAATPVAEWVARETSVKGDRVTFGPTGLFLRLYRNGTTHTAYGIHGHRDSEQWLADAVRFRSAGCIVVHEKILSVLQKTYEANKQTLPVTTVKGMEPVTEEILRRELQEVTLRSGVLAKEKQ